MLSNIWVGWAGTAHEPTPPAHQLLYLCLLIPERLLRTFSGCLRVSLRALLT